MSSGDGPSLFPVSPPSKALGSASLGVLASFFPDTAHLFRHHGKDGQLLFGLKICHPPQRKTSCASTNISDVIKTFWSALLGFCVHTCEQGLGSYESYAGGRALIGSIAS